MNTQLSAVYGRRWRLLLLWYLEGCVGVAAVWAVTHGGTPLAALPPFAFLITCGAALAIPGHALRMMMLALGVRTGGRRTAMQVLLAVAAAATAAALSSEQGWAAIVCILLVGDALWALELELRTP